jgi:hypothetical protein
VERQIP